MSRSAPIRTQRAAISRCCSKPWARRGGTAQPPMRRGCATESFTRSSFFEAEGGGHACRAFRAGRRRGVLRRGALHQHREQPARLGLDDRALLAEWHHAYRRGFAMQGPLALLGCLLGLLAWW